MSSFDHAAVERQIRRLSERELAALIADLWATRGFETTREGTTVVAERDAEPVRLCVVGTTPWRVGPPRRVETSEVDVVVSPTGNVVTVSPGVEVVDCAALSDLLAYGIDRPEAREICERHLGAPPDALPASPSARVSWVVSGLALALAVGLILSAAAGISGGFGTTNLPTVSSEADSPPTVSAAPSTPAPLPPPGDGLPPGVAEDGVTDLDTLATAHADVVGSRSHTIWYDRYQPRKLRPNATRVQRDIDIAAGDGRYLVTTTEVDSGNETYIGAVYREGGVIYQADWNETSQRHERVLRIDWRNVLVPTPYDLRENLVRRYLSAPQTNVTGTTEREGVTVHRVVARGTPNSSSLGEVQNYSAVALVDSRGLVHDVTVRYTSVLSDRTYRVRVEITYARIGQTTVDSPGWFERRNRSAQDPSGANRPL
jgi:hypothetical protein